MEFDVCPFFCDDLLVLVLMRMCGQPVRSSKNWGSKVKSAFETEEREFEGVEMGSSVLKRAIINESGECIAALSQHLQVR